MRCIGTYDIDTKTWTETDCPAFHWAAKGDRVCGWKKQEGVLVRVISPDGRGRELQCGKPYCKATPGCRKITGREKWDGSAPSWCPRDESQKEKLTAGQDLMEQFYAETECYWDKGRNCENRFLCENCEHEPPADEKKNGKNAPVKIGWQESYGGRWPVCSSCGEMPYSTKRCLFCGQKFDQDDERLKEYLKPTVTERMDCIVCGAIGTVYGMRTKSNGHFHGKCENCGARFME